MVVVVMTVMVFVVWIVTFVMFAVMMVMRWRYSDGVADGLVIMVMTVATVLVLC